jgi:hypothetical protein
MIYTKEAPARRYRHTELSTEKYVITGILTNGKRFKPIHTTTPQHYNIWNGSIWQIIDGKRKLIKRIYN